MLRFAAGTAICLTIACAIGLSFQSPRRRAKESKNFIIEHVGIDDGEAVAAFWHHPKFGVSETFSERLRACPRYEDIVARRGDERRLSNRAEISG